MPCGILPVTPCEAHRDDPAVSEIQQACQENRDCGKGSPFFFLVGAGISNPPIPLAFELEEQCRQTAARYRRTQEPLKSDPIARYSHWFRQAFPQREQRQRYLRQVMERAFISRANFRLAHLMLNSSVSNLVATTNFDDSLSRALRLFGHSHVVCDHPRTTARIDLLSQDTQIVHVHGSYWYYDCCNLTTGQGVQRDFSTCRAARWIRDHSPIVIGYSEATNCRSRTGSAGGSGTISGSVSPCRAAESRTRRARRRRALQAGFWAAHAANPSIAPLFSLGEFRLLDPAALEWASSPSS